MKGVCWVPDLLYPVAEVDAQRRQPASILALWGQALACLQASEPGGRGSLLHPGVQAEPVWNP